MSKGSSPAGNTTTTTVNPTQQAQLPYLQGLWNASSQTWQTNPVEPYQGQTLANFDPNLAGGYAQLAANGNPAAPAALDAWTGNQTFQSLAGGQGQVNNSPAYGTLVNYTNGNGLGQDPGQINALNRLGDGDSRVAYGGTPEQQNLWNAVNQLSGLSGSALSGNAGTAGLNNLAGYATQIANGQTPQQWQVGQSSNNISNLAGGLNGVANQAGAIASGGTGAQQQMAYDANEVLSNLARQATGPNSGTNQLESTANGSYLNSNPYLDGMFGSASSAVTRAYQTATAPQTDSNFEAAGRYGSGAHANAQSQNQQDLGSTLNNLASNIYGTNYANERGLQTNAASTLGSLANQQVGLAGELTQGVAGINQNFISDQLAGIGAQGSALNSAVGANQAAGGLQLSQLQNMLAGTQQGSNNYANLANLTNQQIGLAGNLTQAGAGINQNQVSDLLAGSTAGSSAYGTAGNLALGQGQLGLGAANTLQSGFQAGNQNQLGALALAPNVTANNFAPAQAEIQAGQGLTNMSQQQINDLQNRYYQSANSSWDNLTRLANLYGQPTSGSNQVTQPYFTPSTASQLLGLGTGAAGLYNSLGGSGGLFGSGSGAAINGGLTDFGGGGAALGVPDVVAGASGGGGDLGALSFLPALFGK